MRRLGIVAVGLALIVGALSACTRTVERVAVITATPASTATSAARSPTPELRGIWAYCREVGTSLGILEDPPDPAPGHVYRCYQGKPLYCVVAATGGDCAKLSHNEAEPQGLANFCHDNPDETWAPYALTGQWPQMYQWSCQDGQAVRIAEPLFGPLDFDDADFYIPAWQEVPNP